MEDTVHTTVTMMAYALLLRILLRSRLEKEILNGKKFDCTYILIKHLYFRFKKIDKLLEKDLWYHGGEEEEEYTVRKLVEQVYCFNDL